MRKPAQGSAFDNQCASDRGGYRVWSDRGNGAEVRFVGRGPAGDRDRIFRAIGGPQHLAHAWPRQIHSAEVVAAGARAEREEGQAEEGPTGQVGSGDAVWTRDPNLVLSVVSADCVPVLLAGDGVVAAVHAGWRGIAAAVIAATLERLALPAAALEAWVGPAIGPCCYEVGDEVAAQVAGASDRQVVVKGRGERPHLDLPLATRRQLEAAGVTRVRTLGHCTRCEAESLWSYRRDGKGAGRNLAYVWRDA